ncbi:SWIM zinc finger family protein [Paenibacillus alginolyticus]|uniref:SWIM zinc finger family protein n=1 Tax=Paenibacillus alginolyticus TaxID=59839 RepID=A0ABT4G8P1_9BACL|nr:SWIM zinc finger family protein [Paenibacillus alginolyticus]MCY9692539.1 SWIM zinc finger family protein [Paenibacillus alginolyticus]MEC0143745.1 SWIM zinc finger family protein [Paenibacillus alginolyticus]
MLELKIDWEHWTERIRSYFDKTILKRGWNYYNEGAVSEVSTEGTAVIKARVSGSSTYKVNIDLKAFTRSSCSCPYGSYCKHMAAVLFEVAEQEGFDPEELLSPSKAKVLTHPKFDLAPKQAVKLPKATDTCEEWLTYFEKQYTNSKVYNAFSVEELYARAWGQLNKLADDWEPTIRGIYDIQVVLYLMQLCDALAESKSGMYDFFYNGAYYFSKIAKQSWNQLASALREIDDEKAQMMYLGHLKELAVYLTIHVAKASTHSHMNWSEVNKLLWSGLLYEKSLVADELAKLRLIAADQNRDNDAREAAVIGLTHFDIMSENDENAWERVITGVDVIEPEDWFSYLQAFVKEEQWNRLLKWLRWLGPEVRKDASYYASDYLNFWKEVSEHVEVEKEHREAMVTLLPASYREYSSFLLKKEEYKAWADLCLLLDLSPIHIETADLKMVEKADPSVLLPIYHYAAEECIQSKNREAYKEAIRLLKKLATAYKKLKQTPRFEVYVQQLSKQYSRYRAFQEELRKGKIIT